MTISNAGNISAGAELSCDLCIVGAGAAGITLALEMSRAGWRVTILEAGRLNSSGRSKELYKGELVDPARHLPTDADRFRQLGGTTSVWGGRCMPFDPIDFEEREYVSHSGWPVCKDDLDKYYRKAHEYCECGEFNYHLEEVLPNNNAEMIPGLKDGDLETSTVERWSPPTHFGKQYRTELKANTNLQVLLQAVCLDLEQEEDCRQVRRIKVGTFNGKRFYLKAGVIVLAGGGLEVTRLLLASNKISKTGIGNHSDWLGRGYQCHVNGVVAQVKFKPEVRPAFGYEKDADGVYVRRQLRISEDAQHRFRLLNIYMLLDRPQLENPDHRNSFLSLLFLIKQLTSKSVQRIPVKGKWGIYVRHIKNVLKGSSSLLLVLPKWARERFLQGRRIPSLLIGSKENTYSLYYQSEQTPNRASRVSLTDECDMFGIPRIKVDPKIHEMDIDSIVRAHELVKAELRRQGCGELEFNSEDPRSLVHQHMGTLGHHIGTTRMAADPANGVVDQNCKVHGVSNLFIASSSVFPTSSQANPTLTLVALSIRLAEHLKITANQSDRF